MSERMSIISSVEEARQRGDSLPFVLVRQLSEVKRGRTEDIKDQIVWDEVTEVRFFGDCEEIRIFDAGEGLQAARLADANETEFTCRDQEYQLRHKGHFGKSIVLREYFAYDEDGQLFVEATRLKGWR